MAADSLAEVIAAQHLREPFSGVVSVTGPGLPTVQHASGWADRANRRAIDVDTRFAIASGCKVFTAVAVASLIDAGKVRLDTLLSEAIDVSLPHLDDRITISHLLSHTAGNPDYFDEETMDDYAALWSDRPTYGMRAPADFVPMFAHLPQKFPPGERFAYSNAGYILLGLVVEQVSGQPFTDYVQEHVLDPAGMRSTGYFAFDDLPANTALGYLDDSSNATNVFSVPAIGGPDGGAWTTVGDLERFWRSLVAGELVSDPTRDTMLATHAGPDADGQCYGYGVWISDSEPGMTCYVVGEDPGVSMVSSINLATGTVMSILGNTDEAAWPMHGVVIDVLGS